MATNERVSHAVWNGGLMDGSGTVSAGGGLFSGAPVTWKARTESTGPVTSPEELIAAAHAGCYAMALSHVLATAGHPAQELAVTAKVGFGPKPEGGGMKVEYSRLSVVGKVEGIDDAAFAEMAKQGEAGCPVSGALRNNVAIELDAKLG